MKQLKITQRITDRESRSLTAYLNEVRNYPQVTPDEEVELGQRITQGDEDALMKLVQANLRFVVSVAKQYQGYGMTLSDLINEGNMGLIKAAKRFDETRGFKFISYAVWWIRQSILQAISTNSRLVRLPLNKMDEVRKVQEATARLSQKLGREPSVKEIATDLEIPDKKVEQFLTIASKPFSIDAPVMEDEGTSLKELLPVDTPETDSKIVSDSMNEALHTVLGRLNARERQVLQMAFGIGQENPTNLEDIANHFGLTCERIRQIRDRAIRKLRSPSVRKQLAGYLGN
jgi:RNA polymerase primary sigma factor